SALTQSVTVADVAEVVVFAVTRHPEKGVDSRSAQRTADVVPHAPPQIRPTEPACHPLSNTAPLPEY
ncbi:hypothetical protein AB4Z54_28555, partial [Streptomyces sp. MCAF7]